MAVPAAAAAPAAQFDLKCSGTTTTTTIAGKETKPYSTAYRIDLAKKKWCEGECKALHDIYSVQPAEITLRYKNTDTFSERALTSDRIDRETGAHKVTITLANPRSEAHTSELQSLMRISYAVFCLKKKQYKPHKITK